MRLLAPLLVVVGVTLGGCIVIDNHTEVVAPAAAVCPGSLSVVTDTSWSPTAIAAAGNSGWSRDMIPGATWIWPDRTPNGESACLSRRFELPATCGSFRGSLVAGIDDRGSVRVNGIEVLHYGGWSHPSPSVDVTNALRVGENVVEICATNWSAPQCESEECNPAGVLARLDVTFAQPTATPESVRDCSSCDDE